MMDAAPEEENEMKQALTFLTAILALAWASSAAAADGKALYTQYKCNSCHAVSAQGIAVVEEEGEEAEEGEEVERPSDLSDIGTKREASWLKDWLLKKVDIDGKKHRKKYEFKGSDLDTLTKWLATLKDAPKK